MFNRRKFLKSGLFAAIGSILFPNLIFSETLKSDSILDYKPEPFKWSDDQINLAWIGHSTVLINFYGIKILTDPVLMDRVGIYFAGTSLAPSRLTPPALEIDEMPKPDIILL